MKWWIVIGAFATATAIFATTPRGAKIARKLGLQWPSRESAPPQDRDYLLRVCAKDSDLVAKKLAEARRHNPDMSEREAYRRAIRAYLKEYGK